MRSCVAAQPVWSDIPIIVLSRSGYETNALLALIGQLGNVSVVGIDANRAASARYYLYRVLRQLDLSTLLRRAMHEERAQVNEQSVFDERLARDEQERRVEEFRRLIAEEIRRRLVALRGARKAAEAYQEMPIDSRSRIRRKTTP